MTLLDMYLGKINNSAQFFWVIACLLYKCTLIMRACGYVFAYISLLQLNGNCFHSFWTTLCVDRKIELISSKGLRRFNKCWVLALFFKVLIYNFFCAGIPWTEEEHRMFLLGLQKLGKGDWRGIARNYVITRTPTQVASHAQKYFIRQSNVSRRKRRSSLFDIVADEVCTLICKYYTCNMCLFYITLHIMELMPHNLVMAIW